MRVMNGKSDYIAVFDSGLGGISVLRELVRILPNERFLYFGDSANAPYGNRTTQQVKELTLKAAQTLIDRGVKALVIACNTATAAAITTLRETYPDLVIVGIEPALKTAAARFPGGRIGVMATKITLQEEKFSRQLERFPNEQIFRIPAPGLVELVEAGKADSPETEELLCKLLAPYVGKLDALVLGCTHYPFVQKTIVKIMGEEVCLLDGGAGTARQTKRCLEQAGLLREGQGSVELESSSQQPEVLHRAMMLLQG